MFPCTYRIILGTTMQPKFMDSSRRAWNLRGPGRRPVLICGYGYRWRGKVQAECSPTSTHLWMMFHDHPFGWTTFAIFSIYPPLPWPCSVIFPFSQATLSLHSLHAYFLRAGRAELPLIYTVLRFVYLFYAVLQAPRPIYIDCVCVFISNDPMFSLFYMYVLHFQGQRLLQFLHTYRHGSTGWHCHLCADGELSTSRTISPYAPGVLFWTSYQTFVSNTNILCSFFFTPFVSGFMPLYVAPLFNHIGDHASCTISWGSTLRVRALCRFFEGPSTPRRGENV